MPKDRKFHVRCAAVLMLLNLASLCVQQTDRQVRYTLKHVRFSEPTAPSRVLHPTPCSLARPAANLTIRERVHEASRGQPPTCRGHDPFTAHA